MRAMRVLCHALAVPLGVALLLPGQVSAHSDEPQPGDPVPAKVEKALGGDVQIVKGGLYKVRADGERLTTHGPDFPSDFADPVANHGTGLGPGDPERAPFCAANPASDRYQEVLYGYWDPAGSDPGVNDIASTREPIRAHMRRTNAVLNEESLASGGPNADYVMRCEAGEIRVTPFAVTTASGNSRASFSEVVAGAVAAGFTNNRADYTIFYDGPGPSGVCGTGTYRSDDSLSATNANNNPGGTQGGYGVTYRSCWYGATPMHENGHNQGAVQRYAPYSTGTGAHCYDENDVMCYSPDGGDVNQGGTIDRCSDYLHFDCGWDTYFDAAPEAGEWLASHWNLGSPLNAFIVFRDGGGNVTPAADFSVECSGLDCEFTDASSDSDGTIEAYEWSFGDGGTSTAPNPNHTYAAAGPHEVTLTVTDDDGAQTSVSRQIDPGPPPANDDFGAAQGLIGSSDAVLGTNRRATKQAGEPAHALVGGGDGGASVWYRWSAPSDGSVEIGTCGSDFDTLLGVYTGASVGSLSRVASNDDSPGPGCGGTRQSEVSFDAAAGVTYLIAVDGWDPPQTAEDDPDTGAVSLALEFASSAPASDPPTTPSPAPGGSANPATTPPTSETPTTPTSDPPPEGGERAPLLRNRVPLRGRAGPRGSLSPYRIRVPRRARSLRVKLDGPRCAPDGEGGCSPDLDLYLRRGEPPSESEFDCARRRPGSDVSCRIKRPRRGRWHVAVANDSAPEGTGFELVGRVRRR